MANIKTSIDGAHLSQFEATRACRITPSIIANWSQASDTVWSHVPMAGTERPFGLRPGSRQIGQVADFRHDPHAAALAAFGPGVDYYVIHARYDNEMSIWVDPFVGWQRTGGLVYVVDGVYETEKEEVSRG